MSEKRKPKITMLLKWEAKGKMRTNKIELYPMHLFSDKITKFEHQIRSNKYRMRVNGKWFKDGEKQFFYKSDIRDLMWRSMPF